MSNIKLFESKRVRSEWNESEQQWYFSIIDVIEILTESQRPRKYWGDLKKKLLIEGFEQLSEKIGQLKMEASDGKKYLTDVAGVKTLLRIIQSIPSPKAELFKRWLAQIGTIAGDARKALELKTGKKVVSEENYLPETKKKELTKGENKINEK